MTDETDPANVPDSWGLVIARRKGERIVIRVPGRVAPIVVTVGGIEGAYAKVFVRAERDITVDREEIDADKRGRPLSKTSRGAKPPGDDTGG